MKGKAGRVRYWRYGQEAGKRDGSGSGKAGRVRYWRYERESGTGPWRSGKAGRVRDRRYGQAEKSPDLAISDLSRFPRPIGPVPLPPPFNNIGPVPLSRFQKENRATFGPRVGLSSHGSPAKGGTKSKCLARVKIARTSAGPSSLTISDLSRFPASCPAFPLPMDVSGSRMRVVKPQGDASQEGYRGR